MYKIQVMDIYKNTSCPSCGAPADDVDRFAAMAVCEYCGGAFYFKDEAVLAMGKMAIMVEYPTPFYIHATGSFRKKEFQIIGRLRYRYAKGFWDEWYLRFDDDTYKWFVEDEMEFSMEEEVKTPENLPAFDMLYPGCPLIIDKHNLQVDELDVAKLEGAEGSIPFVITKDTMFQYADASQDEYTVTIEYAEDGPEIYQGIWIDKDELKLDYPKDEMEENSGWADA